MKILSLLPVSNVSHSYNKVNWYNISPSFVTQVLKVMPQLASTTTDIKIALSGDWGVRKQMKKEPKANFYNYYHTTRRPH